MQIVQRDINTIRPYSMNPRKNDVSVDRVANSIKEFGFKNPIVIDSEGVIISGHTRHKAARQLGLKEVPCIVADDLTEEQARAYRLADNKAGEDSEWDTGFLDIEMDYLKDLIDMSEFGFDLEDDEDDEKSLEAKVRCEKMQLRAFEHHDYVVFLFDNQMDWLNVVEAFGLKKVDAGYDNCKKIGLGRVIDGGKLLERIGYTCSDNQSGAESVNLDA